MSYCFNVFAALAKINMVMQCR